jgi:hypothetical protein
MWYHTLSAGFRTRISGETDFPCVYDERVGLARSYFKPDGVLSYDNYVKALQLGRSYVTDGGSHILDFSVNGTEAGTGNSEVSLKRNQPIRVSAKVVARLSQQQDEAGAAIANRSLEEQPYWHIERARVGTTQRVRVELIVNGEAVESSVLPADGSWKDITFNYTMKQSGWVALRIYPSSHTNPVFVHVDGTPVRVKRSAEWCRQVVDQCWKMKLPLIRETERAAAQAAYDEARKVYDKMIREAR